MAASSVPKFDMDGLFASEQRRRRESERMYELVLRRVYALVRRINSLNRRLTAVEYAVPRVQHSATRYAWNECVAFVVNRLVDDGFQVTVRRQNILVLSWAHWIPQEQREAFLRSTGSRIDGHGNVSSAATSADDGQGEAHGGGGDAAARTDRAKVKPASALKFRPAATFAAATAAVYSDDLLNQTFMEA